MDGGYSNPEMDKKIDEAASANSIDESNKLLNEAQSILFKDLPHIPLWYSNVSGGSSDQVSNVEIGWDSIPLYYAVVKK